MKRIFTLICGAALACGMTANAYDLVTFEDQELAENSAFVSSEEDGIISGDFMFTYWGHTGYWNGVTVSNMTENTAADFTKQYNNCVGTGAEGSKTFAIAYYSQYDALMNDEYPEIWGNDDFYPEYVYVTNTAYAMNSMVNGDTFAHKFTENDYLKITFTGYTCDEDLEEVEGNSVDYYLAKDGKIVNDWQKVDLSSLGKVSIIRMEMESSDVSSGFFNTPTYFAMDNFKASELPVTAINDIKVETSKAYKTIENGQVVIVNGDARYNIMGQEIK